MLASNNTIALAKMKFKLANKYKIKDLWEARTIISSNINSNLAKQTFKINQYFFYKKSTKKKKHD